jgi:hypothetical protein
MYSMEKTERAPAVPRDAARWEFNGCGEIFRNGQKVAVCSRSIGGNQEVCRFIVRACSDDATLREQLVAAQKEIERKGIALRQLVEKLDQMEKPLMDLCILNHTHGRPYTGPNWAEEMKLARVALAQEKK